MFQKKIPNDLNFMKKSNKKLSRSLTMMALLGRPVTMAGLFFFAGIGAVSLMSSPSVKDVSLGSAPAENVSQAPLNNSHINIIKGTIDDVIRYENLNVAYINFIESGFFSNIPTSSGVKNSLEASFVMPGVLISVLKFTIPSSKGGTSYNELIDIRTKNKESCLYIAKSLKDVRKDMDTSSVTDLETKVEPMCDNHSVRVTASHGYKRTSLTPMAELPPLPNSVQLPRLDTDSLPNIKEQKAPRGSMPPPIK